MPDEVEALLSPTFDLQSMRQLPEELSHPGRGGLESLAIWKRR